MFDWIVDNNAEIVRMPPVKFTRLDGSTYTASFVLRSNNTQWPCAETLQQAIEDAAKALEERAAYHYGAVS